MNITAKIISKSTPYSTLLKPRVGKVVNQDGIYYANTSGVNSELSDGNHWIKIFTPSAGGSVIIDKTAADIQAAGSDFYIDLSGESIPQFPASLSVYVNINGDGNYQVLNPVSYNPVTKTLAGMNSPSDFPTQTLKIVVT